MHPRFRGRLIAVLGASTVLSDHLAGWPEDWHSLLPEAPAELLLPPQGYPLRAVRCGRRRPRPGRRAPVPTGRGPPSPAARRSRPLRRAYRSQLLIIAAHDLAPAVEPSLPTTALPAVCQALTDLADATLQAGLAVAAAELPASAAPARLAVVAMGKCGAKELNYLSDVDVIFVADHPRSGAEAERRRDDADAGHRDASSRPA